MGSTSDLVTPELPTTVCHTSYSTSPPAQGHSWQIPIFALKGTSGWTDGTWRFVRTRSSVAGYPRSLAG